MKKLVNNAIVAAMIFAAAITNTANVYANTASDTLNNADTVVSAISPDEEDALTEEVALDLENWMLENIFANSNEEILNVEAWMSEDLFGNNEEVLNVENWMFDEIFVSNEETLDIEDWMTETIFEAEEPLQLEDWMF